MEEDEGSSNRSRILLSSTIRMKPHPWAGSPKNETGRPADRTEELNLRGNFLISRMSPSRNPLIDYFNNIFEKVITGKALVINRILGI